MPEEDDRNISDLQTDQLEFANVVIINKCVASHSRRAVYPNFALPVLTFPKSYAPLYRCDMVSTSQISKIKSLISTLNPDAKILTTTRSRVDLSEILNTGMFDFTKAAMGAGWLKSLNEDVKPETEEYGISSCEWPRRGLSLVRPRRRLENDEEGARGADAI